MDTIQLKGGDRAGMPALADREPVYVRDENALYVGTPEGAKKVTYTPAEGVADAAEGVTAESLRATVNELLAALRACGLMKT